MTDISLENVIESAIRSRLLDLDVCLPVTIKSYNSTELLADVQPDFDAEFEDGTVIEAPTVKRVPICFPMTSNKAIIFPLEPGDHAVMVCSQRDLDNWKLGFSRGLKDSTIFQLSDGFLIPGVSHKSMIAKHTLAPKKAMSFISDKFFIGDPNARVNPTLAAQGLLQRDLLQILVVLLNNLPTAFTPQTTQEAGKAIATIASLALEIQELSSK